MTPRSNIKNLGLQGFVSFSPSFDRFLSLLRRTLLATLLIGLIWLPGLSDSAIAAPQKIASPTVSSANRSDRISALIDCLPTELSQPNFKRVWNELGDDQLQRIFRLKADPKLSQAEAELANCLSRKGLTS